ncbi:MAG: hypothetical protein AB7U75_15020 [Hyphomicrobiaceae bacterium]
MTGDYISTVSGKRFYYGSGSISIDDVAHNLSVAVRFCGATIFPYTIGQHCLVVEDLLAYMGCDDETRLAGLLHDGHESVMGDPATPFQRWITAEFFGGVDYLSQVKETLDHQILPPLGVPYPFSARVESFVKYADWAAFLAESHVVFDQRPDWLDEYMARSSHIGKDHIDFMIPRVLERPGADIRAEFLDRYRRLTHDRPKTNAA